MDHFVSQLSKQLLTVLTDALPFSAFIQEEQLQQESCDRNALLALCGLGALTTLSKREQNALSSLAKATPTRQ